MDSKGCSVIDIRQEGEVAVSRNQVDQARADTVYPFLASVEI
jgi:hypothetical protein